MLFQTKTGLLKLFLHRMARTAFLIGELNAVSESVAIRAFVEFIFGNFELGGWIFVATFASDGLVITDQREIRFRVIETFEFVGRFWVFRLSEIRPFSVNRMAALAIISE